MPATIDDLPSGARALMLLAALVAFALVWWILGSAVKANPARLAHLVRQGGGALALVAALLLAVRGRFDMAFLVGGGGLWLLGRTSLPFGFGRTNQAVPRRAACLRTAMIEMEIDPVTGAMRGGVLAGPFQGRALADLAPPELRRLAEACARHDPEGERVLQAYLDRRFPGRGEYAQRDPHAGAGADPKSGAMTHEEAQQVLGLEPGAPPDAVRRAHRNLMKKLHPDQGGSTYLASRVNQAKDVLLNRHR